MNKILIVLFILVQTSYSNAQQLSNVDFDQISVTIVDSNSTFYYPKLIDRLLRLDTSLSHQACKHLYYGSVFQDTYHPYGASAKQKEFDKVYAANKSLNDIEKIGLDLLKENPVNLAVLLKMTFLYSREGKKEQATAFAKLYVSFLEVIYASGRGDTCENGFVVISVDDEYLITGDLGLKVVHQDLIGSCDLLTFSKRGQKLGNRIKTLYFNVRMPLTYLSKSFNTPDLPEAEPEPDENE
ncbi:DUF4919 domain-containing protein [Crocinitomix sp.]|nr:DUF4919 domain-containing protein [Crocinitomix sp.]